MEAVQQTTVLTIFVVKNLYCHCLNAVSLFFCTARRALQYTRVSRLISVPLLLLLCKTWETKEWPKEWTQSLAIPLSNNGNLKQCQNYCTISLTSHPSKIMLQVIHNWLKAEELLAEEQAGFRPGRSTVEEIFNSWVIIEEHLQHQHNLFHNFRL